MKRKKWLKEDIDKLSLLYPDENNSVLAAIFSCSISAITGQATKHGLRKSDSFFKSEKSGRLHLAFVGEKTRFKKGYAGWNKGKKQSEYMSAENIEKTKATRFKGGFSHNRLPIGTERFGKDGFVQVKVADGKLQKNWQQKNRVIWESVYGPIPKNHVIEFADGNIMNFDISNLICISRGDNLRKNSLTDSAIAGRFLKVKDEAEKKEFIEKYPHIIEAKRIQLMLNQKIKQNEPTNSK